MPNTVLQKIVDAKNKLEYPDMSGKNHGEAIRLLKDAIKLIVKKEREDIKKLNLLEKYYIIINTPPTAGYGAVQAYESELKEIEEEIKKLLGRK